MNRLPKKEAIQKTKKIKVEKSKPHLLVPEN
jgi:ubiquitin